MALSGQLALAERYGYVESMGSDTVAPGSLVPYDHHTSPIAHADQQQLKAKGHMPGAIYPKEGIRLCPKKKLQPLRLPTREKPQLRRLGANVSNC